MKKERPKPVYITTRSFKSYNASEFCADILEAPWSITDVFDDAEDKLYAFNSLFNDILDKHAPVKTIKLKGKPNCCVTEEIRELMKTRDEWKKTARKTNDPFAWSAFKNFRREVKRRIRFSEREYVREQIKSNRNNTNSIWKSIRTVADEFNEFFASIGQNTVKKIEKMAADENYDLNENPFKPRHYLPSEQFSFTAVEREEVESIVMSMEPNKAPGNDKVPIHVIKTCLTVISPTIISIINASLLTSSFPSVWKNAEVVPIHKSGDHEIANNNRPISLLPVLLKICERAAYNQFSTYLLLNDRLLSKQSIVYTQQKPR